MDTNQNSISNSQSQISIHHPSSITFHVSPFTLHASLFLFLLAIYLLTYTPRINSSDGLAMFSTAESITRRGALGIEQIRWMGLQQGTYGLDGLLYSRKGIGLPVGLLPLTWLGLVMPWFGPVSVSLLFNAIVTALTAVLLLVYIQQLGFSQRSGLIVALTFGLTTLAWPYAKSLFSDPFSGFLLLAAAYTLLKFRQHILTNERGDDKEAPCPPALSKWHTLRYLLYPFLAGLFLGWNVATRYAEAVFLPVYGLLLLYYLGFSLRGQGSLWSRLRPRFLAPNPWPPILAFIIPILIIGSGLVAFNLSRYGDPFNTGYLPNETFSAVLWQGVVGQLVSPGRGLLFYCPIFILSFWGLPSAFRRFRPEAVLASAIIVIHLLLYGKWFMWHGGYAWGPRFMIPTLPFWAIFLAPVVARAFPAKTWQSGVGQAVSLSSPDKLTICPTENKLTVYSTEDDASIQPIRNQDSSTLLLRMSYIILAILGLIPQLLSVTIDFSPFQNSLLDAGLPLFAPQTFFDPQYSPFIGAWAFITRDTLDLAWAWQGQFNGWLLAILAVNVFITGIHLKKQASEPTEQVSRVKYQVSDIRYYILRFTFYVSRIIRHSLNSTLLPILSTLLALILLLTYTHTLPAKPLPQAIAALNEAVRPSDAVITNAPEMAMLFAELYKGSAPVLGLNNGGFPLPNDVTRRLTETMVEHQQVWWLPNWLPPEKSAIEQTLLANGFRARNDDFEGQRLALFAFPSNLTDQTTRINATFEKSIILDKVAYPQITTPGVAFPIELYWQATASVGEDYHVFIHLLTDAGQIVSQADGQPVLWTRPTSTWTIGETIVDRHGLWIPLETTPGTYQLSIGLYHPAHGQRLRLSNGQDLVKCKVIVL